MRARKRRHLEAREQDSMLDFTLTSVANRWHEGNTKWQQRYLAVRCAKHGWHTEISILCQQSGRIELDVCPNHIYKIVSAYGHSI